MEELTKKNGKGVWMREIEKVLKRFDAPLEWFMERIETREEEMEVIRKNGEIEEGEKIQMLRVKKTKNIQEVLEEVEVLIDTHFFNCFRETKSSTFLKKVFENQKCLDMRLLKKTWRSLNCSPRR